MDTQYVQEEIASIKSKIDGLDEEIKGLNEEIKGLNEEIKVADRVGKEAKAHDLQLKQNALIAEKNALIAEKNALIAEKTQLWALLGQQQQQQVVANTENAGEVTIQVGEARKKRWDGLNAVLDINKKAKMKDGHMSLGYSYANWEQVKKYVPLVVGNLQTTTGEGLPQPLLTALHQYLSFATICFGAISEGHEAKRVHFIAPIIIIVCSFFNGGFQILAEEEIEGNRVHAHGHFEFVLKRGDKRICIVEAKKDDILQAKTQSLIGCESLCDVEDQSVSYGIATNYFEWCFLKDEADKITEEMMTVFIENGRPTIESLRAIANKFIAILE